MANLSKLPKVSDAFLSHIGDHTLGKNEWMPCPRCGQGTVDPPSGALVGSIAGGMTIGCWIAIMTVVAIIVGFLFWPAAIVVFVVGLVGIPLLPAMGAALGTVYQCKSCRYSWTFTDVENFKKQLG